MPLPDHLLEPPTDGMPFHDLNAEEAERLIAVLVEAARAHGVAVVTGRFRATTDVELVNTGPVNPYFIEI